jgi:hypothetical protein
MAVNSQLVFELDYYHSIDALIALQPGHQPSPQKDTMKLPTSSLAWKFNKELHHKIQSQVLTYIFIGAY